MQEKATQNVVKDILRAPDAHQGVTIYELLIVSVRLTY